MEQTSTTTTYVQNQKEEFRSLIKALRLAFRLRPLTDATHVFKIKKPETLAIIKKRCTELVKMQNDDEWSCFYETQAASLEPKPYPTLDTIQNVLPWRSSARSRTSIRWFFHYLREIKIIEPTLRLVTGIPVTSLDGSCLFVPTLAAGTPGIICSFGDSK